MALALARVWLAPLVLVLFGGGNVQADQRFFVYDLTTATKFTEVYLAPSGSARWGANQAANDKDRVLDPGERLLITAVARGIYDVKFVDPDGRICIKTGVNLTRETTFDIRDIDLAKCLEDNKRQGDQRP
jgi:hypothetical protein